MVIRRAGGRWAAVAAFVGAGMMAAGAGRPLAGQGAAPLLRGIVDLDYQAGGEAGEGGVSLRRVRLIAQTPAMSGVVARLIVDPSALAVGPAGAVPFRGAPLVEAHADYQPSPGILLRAGQQRLPFGLAAASAAPSLPIPEYPLASRVLMQRVSAFRDLGVAAIAQAGPVEAGAGVFGGAGINVRADNNDARDLVGRVTFAVTPELAVGASGWRGRSGALHRVEGVPRRTFHDDAGFRRWGIDARLARGPLGLSAEYLADRTEHNPGAELPTPDGETLRRHGWSAQAAVRVLPRLELAGRYDRWDPRRGAGPDETTEWTGGASWYLHEERAAPHPRRGRAANFVVRQTRLMVFVEHERPEAQETATRLRTRVDVVF